jgi:hypothetical protein
MKLKDCTKNSKDSGVHLYGYNYSGIRQYSLGPS